MSVLWMDNFNSYGADESYMLNGLPYAAVYTGGGGGLVTDPDPNETGYVMKMDESALGTSSTRLAVPTVGDHVGVAQRIWLSELPAADANRPSVIKWKTSSNTDLYTLLVNPNGGMTLMRTSGTDTVIETTTNPVISPQTWNHIEAYVDTTTGVYEVRLEGITIMTGTDGSPPAVDIGIIEWWDFYDPSGGGSNVDFYVKDLLVWDDSGTAINTFVGPVTIYRLVPNADISSGWSKSTGTEDYPLVDEAPPVDADYIYADATLPAASIMGLTDLPDDIVGIRAVMSVVRGRKTDGGDAVLQISLSPNEGVDWDAGASHAITTSFTYWYDVSELSPDTAAAWTPIEVNDAYIRVNRTT